MNPLNGLLLVDKPTGLTSHDVVHRVRRILGLRAIGHAGTLDPMASGLLILLVGEATKVSDYLLNGDKSYEVSARLGVQTDSLDMTGDILSERPVQVSSEEIARVANDLTGTIDLKVPVHSAVKVEGKKLYQYAHRGEAPKELPIRSMTFFDLEISDISDRSVRFYLRCSKGSFIRSWVDELGRKLGCGAAVESLRRIRSEPFEVSRAITLEDLAEKWESRQQRCGDELLPSWIPLTESLPHFQRIDIEGRDEYLLRNGQISKNLQAHLLGLVRINEPPPPVRVINRQTQDLLALLLAQPGQFYRIRRVFHRA